MPASSSSWSKTSSNFEHHLGQDQMNSYEVNQVLSFFLVNFGSFEVSTI